LPSGYFSYTVFIKGLVVQSTSGTIGLSWSSKSIPYDPKAPGIPIVGLLVPGFGYSIYSYLDPESPGN
jgi:hypothetical protein